MEKIKPAQIQWGIRETSAKEKSGDYIKENGKFNDPGWETIRLQLYFAYAHGASDEIIDYFFATECPIRSIDLDCYRLLAELYSLAAVREGLIEQPEPVTLEALHRFIFTQEQMRHGNTDESSETALSDENIRLLHNLLNAISANTGAKEEYSKRMDSMHEMIVKVKDEAHTKSLEYEHTVADLREQLATKVVEIENLKQFQSLKTENDLLKNEQERKLEISDLKRLLSEEKNKTEKLGQELRQIKECQKETLDTDEQEVIPLPVYDKPRSGKLLWKIFHKGKIKEEQARYEYIIKLLQNDVYPDYQLSFIKRCYQEGMTIEELQALEEPGLPLANLQMLKDILLNAREGNV